MEQRIHLLGIRHHGPGSAALLRQALDAVDPACVLIEGPPEADEMIRYVVAAGMKPPVALLLHASDDANAAVFQPFAEYSPEWQAMVWALTRGRAVRFIDWPAGVSLALKKEDASNVASPKRDGEPDIDPLDAMAEAAGYGDGEAFWNALVEQHGGPGQKALRVFAAIEAAMTEARDHDAERPERNAADALRQIRREAFMRINIRQALSLHQGQIAVVCGAWHLSGLRQAAKPADDKAVIKDLPKVKVNVTWVPWTDTRLSARSGYGAGVISPGWYRHLWALYSSSSVPGVEQFAAIWQAKTAFILREQGYAAPTASAIEAARLALGLSAMRGLSVPGLSEMRDATLATLCYGEPTVLSLIEQKLYVGARVGEIDESVPQMPLARDLVVWQKKTRLQPEDLDREIRLDLRTEAGLLKSTLLHRLGLIEVPWGRLMEAEAGRGTFREVWMLRWVPELSVALAEALIYGVTIEQAAGNRTRERAKLGGSIPELADLIRAALVADLEEAATACIERLQAAAIRASDVTELMRAVVPLVRVLRYGTARKLPEVALRALILSMAVEVNAGVRTGSHGLDQESATARVHAMHGYDEALGLFGDDALASEWKTQMGRMVEDDQVAQSVAGVSLRRLHDTKAWEEEHVAAEFSLHMSGREAQLAGAFLEGFLCGGSELILQDRPLLQLMDQWLCELKEEDFVESLPLLRRSLTGFDSVSRRRLMEILRQGRREESHALAVAPAEDDAAFQAALPLLYQILGIEPRGQ